MTNANKDSEQEYHGLGMASPSRAHRHIQGNIIANYALRTSKRERERLQFEQAVEGPDGREIEPDISYWGSVNPTPDDDDELEDLLLVIEIVHSQKNWDYSYQRVVDAFNFEETMQEGFIYNYENGKWWRLRRDEYGDINTEEGKDYSSVLGLYLHTLVR